MYECLWVSLSRYLQVSVHVYGRCVYMRLRISHFRSNCESISISGMANAAALHVSFISTSAYLCVSVCLRVCLCACVCVCVYARHGVITICSYSPKRENFGSLLPIRPDTTSPGRQWETELVCVCVCVGLCEWSGQPLKNASIVTRLTVFTLTGHESFLRPPNIVLDQPSLWAINTLCLLYEVSLIHIRLTLCTNSRNWDLTPLGTSSYTAIQKGAHSLEWSTFLFNPPWSFIMGFPKTHRSSSVLRIVAGPWAVSMYCGAGHNYITTYRT